MPEIADDETTRATKVPTYRYDAFISYKNKSSRPVAKYLQRELERIARRSEAPAVRIFRDETALTFSDLSETLRRELRESRRLVVLLHRSTRDSWWVNEEIAYWLAHGGDPNRLIVARADPGINLSWDDDTERFRHEDALPPALQGVYRHQPLWIDLSRRRLSRPSADAGELARLCATLLERDPAEILQTEVREQRSRQRRLVGLLAGVSVLLVVAIVASVLAITSRNEAARQRSEAQAQAQSAEALLTGNERPDRAIQLLTQASRTSSDQAVRAAMLSVADGTRRLYRLLPVAQDLGGSAPDDVVLSDDGARLAGWRTDGATVRLGVWDVASGRTLTAATLTDVVLPVGRLELVGDRYAAFCSAGGARLVRLSASSVSAVARIDKGACHLSTMRGGALLVGHDTSGADALVVDGASGATKKFSDVRFAGTDPQGDLAVLQQRGQATAAVRSDLSTSTLSAPSDVQVGDVQDLDAWGRLIVRTAANAFWSGSVNGQGGAYFPVPGDSLAAARVGGPFPGYAWVTPDGHLAWSYGPETVNLSSVRTAPAARPARNEVQLTVSSDGREAVVLFRTSSKGMAQAGVVDLNTHPSGPAMTLRGDKLDWLDGVVEGKGNVLALPGSEGGGFVVTAGYAGRVDRGRGHLVLDPTGRHVVAFGGDALSLWPNGDPAVQLDKSSDARAVAFSGDGGLLAVARPAGPVSVYLTASETDLPSIAPSEQASPTRTTSFGAVSYASSPGGVLRTGTGSGVTQVYADKEGQAAFVNSVSPDGGLLILDISTSDSLGQKLSDQALVVDRSGGSTDPGKKCPNVQAGLLRFLPGPRFTEEVSDAEAQHLVDVSGQEDAATHTVDCRTGKQVNLPRGVALLDYQMDAGKGRIVARQGSGRLQVTTWSRGDQSSLRTTSLPGSEGSDTGVQIDPSGKFAAEWRPKTASVTVLEQSGGQWRATHAVDPIMEDVAGAVPLPSLQLLAVAGTTGQVQLFDLASGRLVLQTTAGQGTTISVGGAEAAEDHGWLAVRLQPSGGSLGDSDWMIRAPVSVDRLRDQLCTKAPRSPECS